MKACKIQNCIKPAGVPGTARGYCYTHYRNEKNTGDALVSLASLKAIQPTHCSVEGCKTKRWALGLCGTHYRRLKTHGEVGGADRLTNPAIGKCQVAKCGNPVRATGLCRKHGLRKWRYGDPLAGNAFQFLYSKCQSRFCNRKHYAKGLCHAHWSSIYSGSISERYESVNQILVGKCDVKSLIARIDFYANKCWICEAPADQMDHVKPISKGGASWPANLRPVCKACNNRKAAKWPLNIQIIQQIKENGVSA